MKWLNKRKPVMAQTVMGYPRRLSFCLDHWAYSHWVDHSKWGRVAFLPHEVMGWLNDFGKALHKGRSA